ncbi:hypothetical protein ACS0TY_010701 [Phlomoides rotata]
MGINEIPLSENRGDYDKNSSRSKNGGALVKRGEEFALEDKDVLEVDENVIIPTCRAVFGSGFGGFGYPKFQSKEGDWYQANLKPSNLHGIQGYAYRVFLSITMILGDGIYHVVYMIIVTIHSFSQKTQLIDESTDGQAYDDKRRIDYFLKDQISTTVAVGHYIVLAGVSTGVVPVIFPQLKWYLINIVIILIFRLSLRSSNGLL